jgi:hypothetical protein
MSADRVTAILKSALESGHQDHPANTMTGVFKFWSQKYQAETTPEITRNLQDELRRWDLVSQQFADDTLLLVGGDQTTLSIDSLAKWLLARTRKVGPEKAVENLTQFLLNDYLEGEEKLAVIGIRIPGSLPLGNGITLTSLPFYTEVDSPHLATIYSSLFSGYIHDSNLSLPIISLVCRSRHRKALFKIGSLSNPMAPFYESRLHDLQNARRFLTIIGDYVCPVPLVVWRPV